MGRSEAQVIWAQEHPCTREPVANNQVRGTREPTFRRLAAGTQTFGGRS